MDRKDIARIQIERRGEQRYWNITMFVVPPPGNIGKTPSYAELVGAAEDVLREAKGLGEDWSASNAEVMARSSRDNRGVHTPYRFRVTLDMVTESTTDEDV